MVTGKRRRDPKRKGGILEDPEEIVARAFSERNVALLAKWFFDHDLAPGQVEIAAEVAFGLHDRTIISAHTRYGKTFALANGLGIRFLRDEAPIRVPVVGPTIKQARLVRDEFAKCVIACPPLQELAGIGRQTRSIDRVNREFTKLSMRFVDGKELNILTAKGLGEGLMGSGGDIVIEDEAALISNETHRTKVMRLLGDAVETGGEFVKLVNPWSKDNHAYDSWNDPTWHKIHIDHERGVAEGRLNAKFRDEQRRELTPTEWQILYESVFPDVAEGQLIPWDWMLRARGRQVLAEGEGKPVYVLDVAEGGVDWSVLTRYRVDHGRHQMDWQREVHFADTTKTVAFVQEHAPPGSRIGVDSIGVGKGPADRLRELGYDVVFIKVSEAPNDPVRYLNKKAELYMDLRRCLEEDRMGLPEEADKVMRDWSRMRYDTDRGKVRVTEDGGKSPDHGDSGAYVFALRTAKQAALGIARPDPLKRF